MKEKIVENKVEETKEYREQVAALVHAYVPPDPQKIQAAQAGGNVSVEPTAATTTMTVKNYLKPGTCSPSASIPAPRRCAASRSARTSRSRKTMT
jgi:hypothetical protein